MAVVLEVVTPVGPVRHALAAGLTIGRAEDNAVVLPSRHVSRHHARIEQHGGELGLVDLGSANGTVLNGQAIEPRAITPLREGDSIAVGDYQLRIAPGEAPRPSPVPASAASPASLFVVTPDWMRRFSLTGNEITIGRSTANQLVIDHPHVSLHHAVIRRTGGDYQVDDVGSTNGIQIGGERITSRLLSDRDVLSLGDGVSLCFLAPEDAADFGPGILTAAPGQVVRVGRDAVCDVVAGHPSVSRVHLRVTGEPGGNGRLEDLGSTNGTFVNGFRLEPNQPVVVQPGDLILAGAVRYAFQRPAAAAAGAREGVAVVARGLHRRVRGGQEILHDVSLRVKAKEFVAIVGASGTGKTTLLNALSGVAPATSGQVLVFGRDLRAAYAALRATIGVVPQEDILHRELPVVNALRYEAALRLPGDTSPAERDARITAVLETLGLTDRAAHLIGTLSGGERKRVSIAAELLTQPAIFFLDEATSGLDPGNEAQFMRLLRRLADDGHTVVLVTHATKNVMLCDQVVFLAKGGHLAFSGPPDEALAYFEVADFDGIYERLAGEGEGTTWGARFRRSPGYARIAEAVGTEPPIAEPSRAHDRPRLSGGGRQFRMLVRRSVDLLVRARLSLALLLLIAPLAGLIMTVSWPRDVLDLETGDANRAIAMAYILAIFAFLIGALLNVREFVKERSVYARERGAGLRLMPYLASKLVLTAAFALYHGLVLTLFAAIAVDLPGFGPRDYAALGITFVLGVSGAAALGLFTSALARREEQAIFFVVAMILTSVVFSGGILPLSDLGPPGRAMAAITNANWTFRGITAALHVQQGDCAAPGLADCEMPGFAAFATAGERQVALGPIDDRYADILGTELWAAWAGMAVLLVVTVAATALVLRGRSAAERG